MNKRTNIPCLFAKYPTVNTNLTPVKLTLMHDMTNRNMSNIGLDKMKEAEESLKNKPILAYINRDEFGGVDFAGHEMELSIDLENDEEPIKVTYLEVPVGIIPESTKIEYYSKDGKTYMTCTGYIYTEYSNETLDLISETSGKCVSVELAVHSGELNDDGIFDIQEFSFLGVTILSDNLIPGMDENCRIELFGDLAEYEEFINKAQTDVSVFEASVDDGDKEPEQDPVDPQPEENREPQDELDPQDNGLEGNPDIDGSLDFSIFKDTCGEVKSLEELHAKVLEMNTQINSLNEENQELKSYKLEIEKANRKSEIESTLANFEELEDVEELKEKALNFEITIEDFEKELFALLGKQLYTKKQTKKVAFTKLPIKDNTNVQDQNRDVLYGGALDDILGYK